MSGYIANFNDLKAICFLIEDEELLKKYNKIWSKVKSIVGKNITSKSVFNDKYLMAKTRSCKGSITTNFNGEVTKQGPECICQSLIVIESVFKSSESQVKSRDISRRIQIQNIMIQNVPLTITLKKKILEKIWSNLLWHSSFSLRGF